MFVNIHPHSSPRYFVVSAHLKKEIFIIPAIYEENKKLLQRVFNVNNGEKHKKHKTLKLSYNFSRQIRVQSCSPALSRTGGGGEWGCEYFILCFSSLFMSQPLRSSFCFIFYLFVKNVYQHVFSTSTFLFFHHFSPPFSLEYTFFFAFSFFFFFTFFFC